jgi:Uma2 family endonuclease
MPQILEKSETSQPLVLEKSEFTSPVPSARADSKIKIWTYDDYARLPENGAFENLTYIHYELIEGELVVSPSPNTQHQRIIGKLFARLHPFAKQHYLGEVFLAPLDVVLSPDNSPQPDLIFVSRERRSIITDDNIQGAPDLVVEIISPTSDRRDRKFQLYARFGIPFYWIVDPRLKLIEEYSLAGGAYRLVCEFNVNEIFQSRLFPGLEISVVEIFSL